MKILSYLPVALCIALLSACAVQPVSTTRSFESLEARAGQQARTGNLGAAAALYKQLADAASGTRRAGFLLKGADLLVQTNRAAEAQRWLSDAAPLADRTQGQQIAVLRGRIALAQNRAQTALDIVGDVQKPIPVDVLRGLAAVRGRALLRLGRYADGVRALVQREIWLDTRSDVIANQRLIWDGLKRAALKSAPPLIGDPIVDGWLALAPIANDVADPAEFRRDLLHWRAVYIDHPAAGGLLADMLSEQRSTNAAPQQIALLLPLSSAQRQAAVAIRDGFLAAHLATADARQSDVHIYDTGTLGAAQAYLRAQLEGADFIVGPLLKANVDKVIAQSGFVPTLALNFAQDDNKTSPATDFYQFALAPEDEARAVADRAYANGARTAVALIASTDWGYRVLNSFRAEFEALGGNLLAFSGFDSSRQDFSAKIKSILNIDRSNERRRRLAANLGVALKFEPRRRRDVDMIFLAADAPAGRLIAPQLRFYSAGDIPTYATRDIYEPGDTTSNTDLDGVLFPDAPILIAPDASSQELKQELQHLWPQRAKQWMQFYGMGFDAYRLMSPLYHTRTATWPIDGASGLLTIDAERRIHRTLPFAQFRNGQPVALAPQSGAGQEILGSR